VLLRLTIRPYHSIFGALCCAVLVLIGCNPAAATGRHKPDTTGSVTADSKPSGEHYFVDFRSRPGYLFGHTFIVYGQLNERGRPIHTHYAGIYPISGQQGLIIGSFIAVPASVRGVKDDYKERPSNIYRLRLSPSQYAHLTHLVGHLKANHKEWNLLFANCNDFAIDVAQGMGMSTPPSWLLPEAFIDGLRDLNSN
jgi:hypothetical protein